MRILKLIVIGIIENRADNEISRVRISIGERLGNRLDENDISGAGVEYSVLKLRESEIKNWKNKWVDRIERL